MRQLIIAMAVLCLFTACADFESNDSKQIENKNSVRSLELADFVKAEVQPTTKAEKYMVYFAWPKLEANHRLRIREEQALTIVDNNQTTFSHEVSHNQIITYDFDVLDAGSKVKLHFSKQVKIPRDFVVREGQSEFLENQKMPVQRLFITSETPLRTNGFNIDIDVDEIISDKGVIESFVENAGAALGASGKNAGKLTLKAKTAIGQLKIIMRGQNGGQGISGAAFTNSAADGKPPGPGYRHCEDTSITQFTSEESAPLARVCTCEQGSNGTNAGNGAKGRAGGQGFAGGDGGTLKVEIQDGSSFLLETESISGIGGAAGLGGPGQPGGVATGSSGMCMGKMGANGSAGPIGDPGTKGVDGKNGLICIYIATEGKNACR